MKLLVVMLLVSALLIFIALWVSFTRALLLTSRYELKKRALSGNENAKAIYALTADGREVYVAMLLGALVGIAGITLLIETVLASMLAVTATAVLVLLIGIYVPFLYGGKNGFSISSKIAPFSVKLLRAMRPVTKPIARKIDEVVGAKSLLYSREQLLHIIEDQASSPYGDVTTDEVKLIKNSLLFSGKIIRDYMTPKRVVAMVKKSEPIGPILLNELHKSGHSRFPVYEESQPEIIVGTLYVRDLIGRKALGTVADVMSKKVYFVHEELDLEHALDAFIKTKHHLFVVVNNFEETVGIITIEDVLEQLLGRQIMDEFDAYENLREVAALRAKRESRDTNRKHV